MAGGIGIDHIAIGVGPQIEVGPGARKNGTQIVGALLLLAGLEGMIEQFAVVVDRSGNIERRFFAAFNLERGHARLGEIVERVPAGEVFHGKQQAGAGGLGGRRIRRLAAEGIAAGIGAGAAIAGASTEQGGIEAQSRVGIAQGTVQEGFDFGWRLRGDGANFGQGELAGEGDALEAEAGGGADAFEVVQRHLGGSVQAQGGKMGAGETGDAKVLDNDGIDAALGAQRERANELGQFCVADQGVEGDVDPARVGQGMGVGDDFFEIGGGEVDSFGTGREAGQAGIDGVGAEGKGGIGGCFFARGGEQFGRGAWGGHAAVGRRFI